jgi:hypothetical protein
VNWASLFEYGGGEESRWTVTSDEPACWQNTAGCPTRREEGDCCWMEGAQLPIDLDFEVLQNSPYCQLGHQVADENSLQALLPLDSSTMPDPTLAPATSSWSWSPGHLGFDDLAVQEHYIVLDNPGIIKDALPSISHVDNGLSFDLNLHELDSEPFESDSRSMTTSNSDCSSSSSPRSLRISLECCKQTFSDRIEFRQHKERIHTQRFHCNKADCYESFTANRSLRRHIKTRHSDGRTMHCPHMTCPYARKGFNRRDSLRLHCQRKHGGDYCGDK